MPLVVRDTIKIAGEKWYPGDVIPQEYEEEEYRNWRPLIQSGKVDRIRREFIEEYQSGDTSEEERSVAHDILSKTVDTIRDRVKQINDLDMLDKMYSMEQNDKQRKTALDAIDNRRTELMDEYA